MDRAQFEKLNTKRLLNCLKKLRKLEKRAHDYEQHTHILEQQEIVKSILDTREHVER